VKRILCFGDSNTWGNISATPDRFPADVRWTGVLQRELGDDYLVIEEGYNGRTTVLEDPVEGRLSGIDYFRPCLDSQSPLDLVIIMLGTNDTKRRFNLSPMTIGEGMMQLIRLTKLYAADAQGNAPKVLIVAPPPILDGLMKSRHGECFGEQAIGVSKGLAAEYARIAKLLRCEFFDAAGWAEVWPGDAVHFTREGHLRLAEGLAGKIRQILI